MREFTPDKNKRTVARRKVSLRNRKLDGEQAMRMVRKALYGVAGELRRGQEGNLSSLRFYLKDKPDDEALKTQLAEEEKIARRVHGLIDWIEGCGHSCDPECDDWNFFGQALSLFWHIDEDVKPYGYKEEQS